MGRRSGRAWSLFAPRGARSRGRRRATRGSRWPRAAPSLRLQVRDFCALVAMVGVCCGLAFTVLALGPCPKVLLFPSVLCSISCRVGGLFGIADVRSSGGLLTVGMRLLGGVFVPEREFCAVARLPFLVAPVSLVALPRIVRVMSAPTRSVSDRAPARVFVVVLFAACPPPPPLVPYFLSRGRWRRRR